MRLTWRRPLAAVVLALLTLLTLLAAPSLTRVARADGDPGSDVLLDQNLFYGSDSGVTIPESLQLGRLLDGTAEVGAPVRVAIIAARFDLGAITALWRRPRQYAEYLGFELSAAYRGRLLVVMPDGFGFYWAGHSVTSGYAALAGVAAPAAGTAGAFFAATRTATRRLENAAGVSAPSLSSAIERAASPAAASSPAAGAGTLAEHPAAAPAPGHFSGWWVALILLVAVTSVFWLPVLWRRRGALRRARIPRVLLAGRSRVGMPWAAFVPPVVVLGCLVLVLHQLEASPSAVSSLATNPSLDPGTALTPRPAPSFTLFDEDGAPVSLRQYRGKVVILSFVDAECQTICPLTTTAMLDAKRALGPAASDVQLLGIDANWRSTQVDDVLNYTELHGLTGEWHFLTGSLTQLNRVWTAYGLNEYALIERQDRAASNLIDHVAATFVIDPEGRLRTLYQTDTSYAAVPQLGQLLAEQAARLLPGHPRVLARYSYAHIGGTPPTVNVTLPRAGGGTVGVGPGASRLYLFFASWDRQTTPLTADLTELGDYEQLARRDHLPRVTAIDEGSVEPSPTALTGLLAGLPDRLRYPVAIDLTGKLADGYDVQGEPWFVLTTATGHIAWYREVYTGGWPSLPALVSDVRGALSHPAGGVTPDAIERELADSPAPLAALHDQAGEIVPGGQHGLDARIRALRGYPIVVNVWGSWCEPCQAEFGIFARASAYYGRRVAFLGADSNEASQADGQQFLNGHHVSYPSYETTIESIQQLLPAGLEATPTTIYISRTGKITHVNIGQYAAQGALDHDIATYLLGG